MDKPDKINFTTIDQYIAAQPTTIQTGLEQLRKLIKKTVPEAEETISYQMPAFKYHGTLIWFAGYNKHYGLYPYSDAIIHFKDKLRAYKTSKGAIQFPTNQPIPEKLITEIVLYRVKANLAKEQAKQLMKKPKKGKSL